MQQDDLPYRDLVDAAPDGMVVCDQSGTVLLVNAEACRMFGYAREELLGKKIDVLVPAGVRPRHHQHVAKFTSNPQLRPMGSGLDLHGARKDGSEFPVEISLSPIATPRGLLVTAGIRDLTERRKLEREKVRATTYLASAVDVIQDAFALFDEHDRVVVANGAARILFGHDIMGVSFGELLTQAVDAGRFELGSATRDMFIETWLAYHKAPSGTLEIRTTAQQHLRVTEHRTADHGTVAIVADITDDVHRADELRQARATAEAASAAKSEFLSSMSHELRTPLNAILGFAQLLERDRKNPLDNRQLERLQHVLRGGEHLLRLIDDVLDLSKIEAGGITISLERVAIGPLIEQVIQTLEPMASRAQIKVWTQSGIEKVPDVSADRTRLSQVLMNFGSNAIKYGREGGFLGFRVEHKEGMVRITAHDNGIGIPEAKRAKIFEPFQRAGQETGPIQGTGIGLTISKRLAKLMRGGVGFTSIEGQGSEFWIEVPVDTTTTVATRSPSTRIPVISSLTDEARKHLVIYVEDNPSNIAFMRDVIEDLPGVELVTAPTAEIGIELIRARVPEVVIMDINLPGMSGLEAVTQLRSIPETKHIPVIGLSAAALVKDQESAREAGFYRYLTKPVKVVELTETLEELIGRAHQAT